MVVTVKGTKEKDNETEKGNRRKGKHKDAIEVYRMREAEEETTRTSGWATKTEARLYKNEDPRPGLVMVGPKVETSQCWR